MGRKRIPDHLKVVKGTDQPCRMNPDAPTQSDGRPNPPDHLGDEEAWWFCVIRERMEKIETSSDTFTEIMATAAERVAEIIELKEIIAKDGRVYESEKLNKTGDVVGYMKRTNPAVTQRNEAQRHLHSLLAELGLTPSALSKTISAKSKKKENPFAKFGS